MHHDASAACSTAAVEGDAAKAVLLKIVKMVACIIMEVVVQLPVFICTDNPSIVNEVVENMYNCS